MSVTTVTYQGSLQSSVNFTAGNLVVPIDVPVDLGGTDSAPSPTDFVAAGLGGCLLVTMGMIAARRGWDISGSTAVVEKTMTTTKPLRIARLATTVSIPNAGRFDETQRAVLARAAQHCAVHHSLHPEIEAPISFEWKEGL